MSRPGDWNCRSCQHLNFQRRDSCQRCGDPRPGERDHYGSFGGRSSGGSIGLTGPDVRPGDWYCTAGNCGAHNFASRSSCFKCGVSKDESSGGGLDADMSRMRGYGFGGGGGSGSSRNWKSGDWICTRLMHINLFIPFKSEKYLIWHPLPPHILNLNFTGPVATSTTLLAGLNAIDAMHPENLAATSLPINHRIR